MNNILNYSKLEKLESTKNTYLYRAQKDNDDNTVLLKIFKTVQASPAEIARFTQGHENIKNISLDGIVNINEIVNYDNNFILILEDFPGVPLDLLIAEEKITFERFLNIAVIISETVAKLHDFNILHKNIIPHNILVSKDAPYVKLTNFGIEEELTHEHQDFYAPGITRKFLPYISPEQTGRMNRSVDYRSDIYSLGTVFYEILCGRPPFESDDPLELLHSHIARKPIEPNKIDPSIPDVISEIILKLLAKAPEERYQNCFGLLNDLNKCLKEHKKTNTITSFKIAQKDYSIKFNIPQILFGRDEETELLMSIFERVRNGEREALFISGSPGVGKSALVHSIYEDIIAKKGIFLTGKYDKFRHNVPYSSIIQAFQGLIKQILSEDKEKIDSWKKKITDGIATNGKILTDMIPEIELIIGKQANIQTLGPEESQIRFHSVFANFIKVFTSKDRPITLFLDDLQWFDSASLQLLKKILSDPSVKYLLFIGSFRSVDCAGPDILMELLRDDITIHQLSLLPLSINSVNEIISNFLNCEKETSLPLSKLIHSKTNGNPFFINQFLKTLFDDGLLKIDRNLGWKWDIQDIMTMQVTDNVVDLMTNKITKLHRSTQKLLEICSCIGNRFTLETISTILNKSIEDTLSILTEAIQEGLLSTYNNYYVFQHDRIQEAAYSLIPIAERNEIHYKIGKLFLEKTPDKDLYEKIFYIVNHLNFKAEDLKNDNERIELAKLNLMASMKAKGSSAYEEAQQFLKKGITLLPKESWNNSYTLTLSLYTESGELEHLLGRHTAAERLYDEIIKNAKTPLDKIRVFESRINYLAGSQKTKQALELGTSTLKLLGFKISLNVSFLSLSKEFLLSKINLANKTENAILNLPAFSDPNKIAISRILTSCIAPSYLGFPEYTPYLVLKLLNFSLKNGNSIYSPFSYITYAVMLCTKLNNIDKGYKFGEMSINLSEKYYAEKVKPTVYFIFASMINHWKNPLRDSIDLLIKAQKKGVETGDIAFASYALTHQITHSFFTGTGLQEIEKKFEANYPTIKKYNKLISIRLYCLWHQMTINLLGKTEESSELDGPVFNEKKISAEWIKANQSNSLGNYSLVKAMLFYLNGMFEKAVRICEESEKYAENLLGMYYLPEFYFFYSLSLLANFKNTTHLKQPASILTASSNQKKMKKWAEHCPENFLHKYYLVEAELNRVKNKIDEAIDFYEKAVQTAKTNGFTQDQAIASELSSLFWLDHGNYDTAKAYMNNAYNCYSRWGAKIKLKEIEEKYGEMLDEIGFRADKRAASKPASDQIGLKTLGKSLKTIAEEKIHRRMIEKIIRIAIEFAGAQRGVLILRHGSTNEEEKERLFVEAEGTIDAYKISMLQSIPVESMQNISQSVVNFVQRTKENIVIHDALVPQENLPLLESEEYIKENGIKSILCMPILTDSSAGPELIGMLYLENNLATHTFTEERIETLEIICLSAAGRIELSQKAVTDGLTNLYNHEYFQNILRQEILLSNRQKHELSLIMLDIDHFKDFNDKCGHQVGDLVLQKVAHTIRESCRESDIVARYGGEEFAILLRETSPANAGMIAEKIRKIIENLDVQYIASEQEILKVTISCGVAGYPLNAQGKNMLIKKADDALYVSKQNGRNQVNIAE